VKTADYARIHKAHSPTHDPFLHFSIRATRPQDAPRSHTLDRGTIFIQLMKRSANIQSRRRLKKALAEQMPNGREQSSPFLVNFAVL
jgi:hypothetical protein